jgi:hypothetical protein
MSLSAQSAIRNPQSAIRIQED